MAESKQPYDDDTAKPKKAKPDTRSPEQKSHDAEYSDPGTDDIKSYSEYVDARALDLWEARHTGHNLTVEQQMFCRSYIIDRNPVAALLRLRYAGTVHTLKQRAKRMLAEPEVQACIETLSKELMEKLEITAERVQAAVAAVSFFDIREVASFDGIGVSLLHSRYWTKDQAMAVQSVKMGQNGLEIKLYDRMKGLEMLAKQIGLQKDDSDPATQARDAAEETVKQLFSYLERTHEAPPEPDEPKTLQ